jgi:hypothetical protein
MTGERETRVTYPDFFKNRAGDLFFCYRDGGSGDGDNFCNAYEPATRTWRRLFNAPLHEGEGLRNAYVTSPLVGPDGYFHILCIWRDTPDAATNHSLSYARSRDLISWETSTGKPIPLPITLAKSELVDASPPGGGLINSVRSLGFDHKGRPLATYHRYDGAGNSQLFIARPQPDGGWRSHQMTKWNFRWAFGGNGSLGTEVRVGAAQPQPDGALEVAYTSKVAGAGRIKLDGESLQVLTLLPPAPSPFPEELLKVRGSFPGLEVQTATTRADVRRWLLRWETQSRNRDQPRAALSPPSDLILYEFPDSENPSQPDPRQNPVSDP